jgi:hypothetical protein
VKTSAFRPLSVRAGRAVLRVGVHALEVIGGHEKQFARRGGRDARLVRMDVCTNVPGARRDSNMTADTYLLRDSMQTEKTAPDGTFFDDLSLEAEQWERDNAAVRAEFLRRRQAEIEDRRQFGKPINPAMLARIMGAWVSASLESRA